MSLKEIVISAIVGGLIGYTVNSHDGYQQTGIDNKRTDTVYRLRTEELTLHHKKGTNYNCIIGSMDTSSKVFFSFDDGELFALETNYGMTDNKGKRYDNTEIVQMLSPLFGVKHSPEIEITAIPLTEESGKRIYDVLQFNFNQTIYTRFRKGE